MHTLKQALTLTAILAGLGYGGYLLFAEYAADLPPLVFTLAVVSASPAIAARTLGKLINR